MADCRELRDERSEMKIELMHSITHDATEYTPGVHDLPEDLAKLFLSYSWATREFSPATEAKAGTVKAVTVGAPNAPAQSPAPPQTEEPNGKGKR